MGDVLSESAAVARRVAIGASPRREAMVAYARAAGWTVAEEARVRVVDLAAEELGPVPGAAIVAIGDSERAVAAGATHWLAAGFTPAEFLLALRLADGVARRLVPPLLFGRRRGEEEPAPDAPLLSQIAVAQAAGPVTVALVALTRFEFVNAAFGRAVGDALMAAAQARIGDWADAAFGARAQVARRDGATFAVIAPTTGNGAIEALESALARPFEAEGASVSLASRIGLAESIAGETPARLLRRAREALAEARTKDAATTHVADREDAVALDRLAADLHHALEGEQISVLFQPQVALATGAIVGVEALARWDHPRFGALGAGILFAAAERADLGIALSDHIQRLALDRAAAWPGSLARLRLSINVTAADLARPGFAATFLERVETSGFARARLTVEIVETGLIVDFERAAAILSTLRGAGCRIAIDDFGTGYSSLAYLKALPIDYLKLDRSLTTDIAGSERDTVIVRGVIAIARSLGLETIAEGVEREDERALLAVAGCDLYQGFLCAGPLGVDGLERLLAG